MESLDISINQLARDLAVPPNRISEIVNGKRAITADTALRLQRYFGVEAQFWLKSYQYINTRMSQINHSMSFRASRCTKVAPRLCARRTMSSVPPGPSPVAPFQSAISVRLSFDIARAPWSIHRLERCQTL